MTTYQELKARAEELMRQAEAAKKVEIASVIDEITAKMAEYQITIADLKIASKKTLANRALATKYRHPATGRTWSGRGRPPHWLAEELAKGRTREEFLVG